MIGQLSIKNVGINFDISKILPTIAKTKFFDITPDVTNTITTQRRETL
nr:MAG: hypothetical protein [Microvirus sp.]